VQLRDSIPQAPAALRFFVLGDYAPCPMATRAIVSVARGRVDGAETLQRGQLLTSQHRFKNGHNNAAAHNTARNLHIAPAASLIEVY
jgi:hypothetical protein